MIRVSLSLRPRSRRASVSSLVAAGLVAALLAPLACAPETQAEGPSVLLISLDSVRGDFLTFLDAETAPNLTKLAQRGTIFTQAISGTSWTLPAHLQMFTGMPPMLHGVQESDLRLDPMIPSLPRILRGAGYDCAGYYTCWYLNGEFGFADGFSTYRNSMPGGEYLEKALAEALESDGDINSRRREFEGMDRNAQASSSPTVTENAVGYLESLDPEEPFFLFTHFFDPHFDYVPPAPYHEAFDPDYEGELTGANYWTNTSIWDPDATPQRRVSDRDLDHIRALYRGEIAWTDASIGALLDKLEELGRLDDTLIIVTADHGDEFFEHDNRGHRRTLYDEVVHVPLLVVPPSGRATPTRISDDQVSLSDILPTILDYANVDLPPTVYGRSLSPQIEGAPNQDRPLVTSLCVPLDDPSKGSGRALLESLRTPEYKLLRWWTQFDGEAAPSMHLVEYFDLTTDPGEQAPLSGLNHPPVRQAWAVLEREMNDIRTRWDARAKTPLDQLSTDIQLIVGDDLAQLGYASAGERDATPALRRLGVAPLPPSTLTRTKASTSGGGE